MPISTTISLAEAPITPAVSIAMGSNLYLFASSEYLVLLRSSALAAAIPAVDAESLTELSAYVFTHVASQARAFPRLKGKMVMPSGLIPFAWLRPTGSSVEGDPADFSALQIMSFNAACLGSLPSPKWHESRWKPYSSTILPHLHLCFSQTFEPVLKAIAILNSSGFNCVPRLGTGIAPAQEPDSACAEAKRRALANWSSAFSSRVFCSWTT